jgi:hypothetical protein
MKARERAGLKRPTSWIEEANVGRVADTKDNMANSICGDCPSIPQGDLGFYCAKGKSSQPVRRRGCICGDCKNWVEYGLAKAYYCDEGVTE